MTCAVFPSFKVPKPLQGNANWVSTNAKTWAYTKRADFATPAVLVNKLGGGAIEVVDA